MPEFNSVYPIGEGPIVMIDGGHNNFHRRSGRFLAFSDLLEKDGYKVIAYSGKFTNEKLKEGEVLVISNALNKINHGNKNWRNPVLSAFGEKEIGDS